MKNGANIKAFYAYKYNSYELCNIKKMIEGNFVL